MHCSLEWLCINRGLTCYVLLSIMCHFKITRVLVLLRNPTKTHILPQTYSKWHFLLEWAELWTYCGLSILRLYYCNIMGDRTLACQAFQAFLPQDYATMVRGGGFGWCVTLNWTHQGPLHSVWDIYSISPFLCQSVSLSLAASPYSPLFVCLSLFSLTDLCSAFVFFLKMLYRHEIQVL